MSAKLTKPQAAPRPPKKSPRINPPVDEAASSPPKVTAFPPTQIAAFNPTNMNAEMIVKLIEEMVDIKVQQQAETHIHVKPELARLLEEKPHGDRRRLEMIKQELTRQL